MNAQDQWEIRQLLSLAVHIADSGEWEALDRVFTADAVIESAASGESAESGESGEAAESVDRRYRGPAGAAEFERVERGPSVQARHTLNTVIRGGDVRGGDPERAYAWSRYMLVTDRATALGGDLLDTLVRVDGEWRIQHRRVTERNRRAPGQLDGGGGRGESGESGGDPEPGPNNPYRSDEGESFASWLAAS
ncbi:MAG: nuclear transport factor 2 family protein [Leucobacter sp.]